MRVLLIEDDRILGESLKEYLSSFNISVEWLNDPRVAADFLKFASFDVIVLDLIMPHVSGEELLKKIRENDKRTPILILTAKGRIEDKERCFTLGADDYLTKPFEPKELLLRIRALYRRRVPQTVIKIGDVEIDLEKENLFVKGVPVKLNRKDWLVLKHLVENRGRFVPSEEILNYVWAGEAVGEDVVRAHIKSLRKLLPEGFIQTIKGRGYKVE